MHVGIPIIIYAKMPDESEYQLSEYELLRLERIKRNQARLEELGLVDKPWNNKQQPKKKKKKTTPRKKAKTPRPGQERRSKRLSGKPQQLLQLSNHHEDEVVVEQGDDTDADFDADEEEVEPYQAKVSVRQVRRRVNLDRDKYSVSKEDMTNLRGGMDVETFLAKFQEFLRYEVSACARLCRVELGSTTNHLGLLQSSRILFCAHVHHS